MSTKAGAAGDLDVRQLELGNGMDHTFGASVEREEGEGYASGEDTLEWEGERIDEFLEEWVHSDKVKYQHRDLESEDAAKIQDTLLYDAVK